MNKAATLIFSLLFLVAGIHPGYCHLKALTIQPDTLRVGVIKQDLFPFIYLHAPQQAKGYEIDIIRDFQKELGLRNIHIIQFNDQRSLFNGLENNEIDCAISKLKGNTRDAQSVIYSDFYINLNAVFLINRRVKARRHHQAEKPDTFSDSVILGTLAEDPFFYQQLNKIYPRNPIVSTTTFEQLMELLIRGQIEACVIDEAAAQEYFRQHPEMSLYLSYVAWPIWQESAAIAFSWRNQYLRDLANIFLLSHKESEMTLDTLIQMYSDHYPH